MQPESDSTLAVCPIMIPKGAVDCDVHIAVPSTRVLLPYLDDHWREQIVLRGIDGLDLVSYKPSLPISCRPDFRSAQDKPGSRLDMLQAQALDAFGTSYAIGNCVWGGQATHSDDLAIALCRAVNDWVAREWLDREPRLRASIIVPAHAPELAGEEIERCAQDKRFVQVLLLAMGESPLGRRHHWPIYRAAERSGLPIGIHAGSAFRHPTTPTGWPSFFVEDHVAQAQAFQGQLLSLIYEGVFAKFPDLRFVLIESGVTWLPSFLWRADKTWRAMRAEVPWVQRSPAEIVRESVRMTIQPFDGPADPAQLERVLNQIGSDDMLLFSTDYPHWHFEGQAALPPGLPHGLADKILVDNPRATYARLNEIVQ